MSLNGVYVARSLWSLGHADDGLPQQVQRSTEVGIGNHRGYILYIPLLYHSPPTIVHCVCTSLGHAIRFVKLPLDREEEQVEGSEQTVSYLPVLPL